MVSPSGEVGVQDTLILVGPSCAAVTSLGGEAAGEGIIRNTRVILYFIPLTMMLAESEDGLLLDTVQVYSPPVVTVRVCVYCAVTGSSNTVSVLPSVTVVESLVQVTVVAGPPVEIQVRVTWGFAPWRSAFIVNAIP